MCCPVQRNFTPNGGKLVRLEFPHTEVQHFGDFAIVWSQYLAETETNGKRSSDCRLYPGEFLVRALRRVKPPCPLIPKYLGHADR